VPTGDERTGNFSQPISGGVTLSFFAQTLNSRCGLNMPMPSTQPNGLFLFDDLQNSVIPSDLHGSDGAGSTEPIRSNSNRPDGTFQGVPLGHETSDQFTIKIDHQLTKTSACLATTTYRSLSCQ